MLLTAVFRLASMNGNCDFKRASKAAAADTKTLTGGSNFTRREGGKKKVGRWD